MKKKIFGTSNAWLTSHLSQRTSKPAYYIVDCWISELYHVLDGRLVNAIYFLSHTGKYDPFYSKYLLLFLKSSGIICTVNITLYHMSKIPITCLHIVKLLTNRGCKSWIISLKSLCYKTKSFVFNVVVCVLSISWIHISKKDVKMKVELHLNPGLFNPKFQP